MVFSFPTAANFKIKIVTQIVNLRVVCLFTPECIRQLSALHQKTMNYLELIWQQFFSANLVCKLLANIAFFSPPRFSVSPSSLETWKVKSIAMGTIEISFPCFNVSWNLHEYDFLYPFCEVHNSSRAWDHFEQIWKKDQKKKKKKRNSQLKLSNSINWQCLTACDNQVIEVSVRWEWYCSLRNLPLMHGILKPLEILRWFLMIG